jgi:hypothetical protein
MVHAQDDSLLSADVIGSFLSDTAPAEDPFASAAPTSSSPVSDPFGISGPNADQATESSLPQATSSAPKIEVPTLVRASPINGPQPINPTLQPIYKFEETTIQSAVAAIARDLPQPVALELVTRLSVNGDYTGQTPIQALRSLVDDAGLHLGVYRDTIYIFEEGTANRIAQMIVRDRSVAEQFNDRVKTTTDIPRPQAVSDEVIPVESTASDVPLPSLSEEQIRQLEKLRKQRALLLKERDRIS